VAVHESEVVGSRNLGGLGHLPEVGNDVGTPFDKPFSDSRADPLRSSRSRWLSSSAAHHCYLENIL
jgi:hypothetical protein